MQYFLPITLEELKNLSDEEVVKRINDKIAPEIGTSMLSFPDFVSAQFYMAELDRRERRRDDAKRDESETRRRRLDLLLEGIVIGLIGLELIVAVVLFIVGGRQQSRDVTQQLRAFSDMQSVMTQMEESSTATAIAMTELKKTTEAMNQGIQTQLGLNYALTVELTADNGWRGFSVKNTGKTTIYLCGVEAGYNDPWFPKKPVAIIPGANATFATPVLYDDVSDLPEGGSQKLPLRVFLRNEYGVKYVIGSEITGRREKDNITFKVDRFGVDRENWSRK
jgi:hypothetical protein